MARNTQGEIPDDHFENEPGPPPKESPPLSQALLDHIEKIKAERGKPDPAKVGGC